MTISEFLVASRTIHFASVMALFGSPLFWLLLPRPERDFLPNARRRMIVVLRLAAVLAAISGLAWLMESLAYMTGSFHDAFNLEALRLYFFETSFGPLSFLRLALLTAGLCIALLPLRDGVFLPMLFLIAAALLVTQAWLGHAAEGATPLKSVSMIGAYSFHVLASAAWIGSLPVLFLALSEQRAESSTIAKARIFDILSRYSLMAVIAVALIFVTGIANVLFHAGPFGRLLESAYGKILGTKVCTVILMLALACFNRFLAMPNLKAIKAAADINRLRRSIMVELGLGALVIGLAATLGITPPPH